ncbi:MAG: sodium/glutamate symporter, partial [Pygmaiobacter massiliensis]
MEITTIEIGMFQTLAIAILAIYLGEFLRKKIPAIKKYCIPAAVVGGTIFSIVTCILYVTNVVAFSFDYSTMNTFFYNVFFAASGCAASMALLKKGGKLVVIFSVLAAVLAALQNALALGVGTAMGMNPLVALMAGSTPLTGGHGNAASFGPIAESMGGTGAVEVAVAA